MKNLKNILFAERFKITNDIAAMVNYAQGGSYRLSIPLLIAGFMGSRYYQEVQTFMKISLEQDGMQSFANRSLKAWMLGRLIQADMAMGEDTSETVQALKDLLTDLGTEDADSFATWAWGYLAYADYSFAKENMISTATNLKVSVPDQLWAWVMCTQAAAQAKDKTTYTDCLEQIKKITHKPTVAEALMSGLTRDEKNNNNDFPAWAMAIIYSSAQMMGDMEQMSEIEVGLLASIEKTKEIVAMRSQANPEFAIKVLAEERLAEVIHCLAQERQKAAPRNEVRNNVQKQ